MVSEIQLNDRKIHVKKYKGKNDKDGVEISVTFNVTSEEYHDIATLLYNETFDVKIPEKHLEFPGVIQKYSTSITNLYEEGNVGEYKLTLKEIGK